MENNFRRRLTFDPAVGTLYYVPNSDSLNVLYYSKQFFYHDMFRHDTNCFFAIRREDNGDLVYAKVYGHRVRHSIKVRGLPIWIKYDEFVKIPDKVLTVTEFQFDDPDYLIKRIKSEKVFLDIDDLIREENSRKFYEKYMKNLKSAARQLTGPVRAVAVPDNI